MKKIIFTLTTFVLLSIVAAPAFSYWLPEDGIKKTALEDGKKKSITIGSNRVSGDILVRFAADQAGEVSIAVLNEAGEIITRQTNPVTKSMNAIPLKNMTSLNEGVYTVQLTDNKETYSTQLLIWK